MKIKMKFCNIELFTLECLGRYYLFVASDDKSYFSCSIKKVSRVDIKELAREKMQRFVDIVTLRTVYFYESGMDCDCVSFGGGRKYRNIFAAEKSMNESYHWAEGALHYSRMTKAEYLESESFTRDLAMEAHENGHGHIVYRN